MKKYFIPHIFLACSVYGVMFFHDHSYGKKFTNNPNPVINPTISAPVTPENFIKNVGEKIIGLLKEKILPLEDRKNKFGLIIDEYFDIETIGKFTLGHLRRQIQPHNLNEYIKCMRNYIIDMYAKQFDHYGNESFKVLSTMTNQQGGFTVKSEVMRENIEKPLSVYWQVFMTNRGMKVTDIIVNGVSMSLTHRTEFSGIWTKSGKGFEGLMDHLRGSSQPLSKNKT
jgi:phospholipid transport system substrate-binding protein